jgi:N-acetylglucosamine-6-phosphate deacetylase
MSSYAIRGNLVLGQHLDTGTIIVEDGVITRVVREQLPDGNLPAIVHEADIVSAGMIDLQVNGAIGLETCESAEAIERISQWMTGSGVTAWLPTIVTSPASFYPGVFEHWRAVDRNIGATPLGLHLEGPFLTPEKKGAHRLDWIEAANDEILDFWLQQDGIALVTLSPEREGNFDRIRKLVDRGILVSLGHTNATFEQFEAGVDAGARKATHLFNAMTSIHHRQPGAMVATMLDDRITAGLIPDGVHSHPATIRLAVKTKGPDYIAIVSDMMAACGHGPGVYTLGGRKVTVDERSATLEDGTLAGSILTMDQAIRNVVAWTGISIAETLHMATAVPALLLGIADRGSIRVGARADLVLWSHDLQVRQTLLANGSTPAA